MTEKEARRLLLYTVVEWLGEDPEDDTAGTLGTVIGIDYYAGLLIQWADGITDWMPFYGMTHVEIHKQGEHND